MLKAWSPTGGTVLGDDRDWRDGYNWRLSSVSPGPTELGSSSAHMSPQLLNHPEA